MITALRQAVELVLSGNRMLANIVEVTLRMSLSSSIVSLLLGVPLGALLAFGTFRGKNVLVILNRTLMGVPPVVCGLICYMLFSGVGPFRHFRLMYTVRLMVIAQVLLITPLIIGNMETFAQRIAPTVRETATGLGLSRGKSFLLLINESRYQIFSSYLFGFSRAIAEVGAVSMVGGAIAYKTNVMTTAIMNYTNRGDFTLGVALGIILLAMSLVLNLAVSLLQGRLSR